MCDRGRIPRCAGWVAAAIVLLLGTGPTAQAALVLRRQRPIQGLSAGQIDSLARDSASARLVRERQDVAEEIAAAGMYDPKRVNVARRILAAGPADTSANNIERITAALAAVDMRMAEVTRLVAAGEHAAAAAAATELIDPEGHRYVDAAARLLQADALRVAGQAGEAAEAYVQLVRAMPEKVSFAATAALRAGDTYERMGRMVHAAQLYAWWVANYSFLDPARVKRLAAKVESVDRQYDDPLATLADLMGQAHARLADADSGEAAMATQKDIVTMLDDLIALVEENRDPPDRAQRSESSDRGSDRPTGVPGRPSHPAEQSALPGGQATRPVAATVIHPDGESDPWGQLPIRQREKLVETFRQRYPQRYTEMLRAYYKRLAESE